MIQTDPRTRATKVEGRECAKALRQKGPKPTLPGARGISSSRLWSIL